MILTHRIAEGLLELKLLIASILGDVQVKFDGLGTPGSWKESIYPERCPLDCWATFPSLRPLSILRALAISAAKIVDRTTPRHRIRFISSSVIFYSSPRRA